MTILTSDRPRGKNLNALGLSDLFNADVQVLILHACCAAVVAALLTRGAAARCLVTCTGNTAATAVFREVTEMDAQQDGANILKLIPIFMYLFIYRVFSIGVSRSLTLCCYSSGGLTCSLCLNREILTVANQNENAYS